MARSGIVAAVIGVLAITSLSGASAASLSVTATARASVPASSSSPASASDGHTTCVPWPKPTSLGLKCTGTYSGSTAWNPWTWHSIPQQPVVTVSQVKDLTDQGVQISWSDFTPTLDNNTFTPNPTTLNPLYQVSIFECKGTNPDASRGFGEPQCYMVPVGSSPSQARQGPPNGLLESTLDTSSPTGPCSSSPSSFPRSSVLCAYPDKSRWDGGNPATWIGQADFHVEAPTPRSQGGFFNCGPRTPCSLVVVPNWGGTPVYNYKTDAYTWTNTSLCGQHWLGYNLDPIGKHNPDLLGNPKPYPDPGETGDLLSGTGMPAFGEPITLAGNGNTGSLQGGSYACWAANRIVIPLSFAPTPGDCPNKAPEFYAEGSPMMQTQVLQWQAEWCTGRAPVTLEYTATSEALARADFLAGSQVGGARIDMALVTLPATAAQQRASHRKFTYAPLANSGTGIAFTVDDAKTGAQINRMVLDPRLLAKLTTQSYTLQYRCTRADHTKPSLACDPAVWGTGKNAYSLFDDPEFLSLNKNCQPYGQPASYICRNPSKGTDETTDDFPPNITVDGSTQWGAFLPTVLQPDSDMTYDLTGWIAANPDAAAFLNGTPDPSGMRVNSNYLHVPYPEQAFIPLDTGYTRPVTCSKAYGCPVGVQDVTMQATWNPQPTLDGITTDLLTDQATAAAPVDGCSLPAPAICTKASELTLTSPMPPQLPGRDLLSEMDLGDIANYLFPAADLVNRAGDAVGPTQAGVEAAVSVMKTNPDGITQHFDFASTDPAAYPLTMVDYAMIPTCGLSHAEASAIADFLTKVATTGQAQGRAPGDLAPGYYPLTARQRSQTLKAAQEVEKQTCTSPPPDQTTGR
jgi:hypothetical protein